jgi:hypothetical protein
MEMLNFFDLNIHSPTFRCTPGELRSGVVPPKD